VARVEGLDPQQASFLDVAGLQKGPQDVGPGSDSTNDLGRVPRVFWINALAEWLLDRERGPTKRQRMLLTLRTAARIVGVRSESMPILPEAECTV